MAGVKRSLVINFLIAYAWSLVWLVRAIQSSNTSSQLQPVVPAEVVRLTNQPATVLVGLPIRLKISRLSVDATIETVGLTTDGAMDVPKSPGNVAWFQLGPRPGDIGSAVIDGHYGVKNGKASVFDRLIELQAGDKLSIEDDAGAHTTFVVQKVHSYSPKADASAVFASTDGLAHLNLITCEGIWNTTLKGYPERLVVFTTKE